MKLIEQHDFNDAVELRSYMEQYFPQSAGERKFTSSDGREVRVDGLSVAIYEAEPSIESAGEAPAAPPDSPDEAAPPNVTEFPSPEARAEGDGEPSDL